MAEAAEAVAVETAKMTNLMPNQVIALLTEQVAVAVAAKANLVEQVVLLMDKQVQYQLLVQVEQDKQEAVTLVMAVQVVALVQLVKVGKLVKDYKAEQVKILQLVLEVLVERLVKLHN